MGLLKMILLIALAQTTLAEPTKWWVKCRHLACREETSRVVRNPAEHPAYRQGKWSTLFRVYSRGTRPGSLQKEDFWYQMTTNTEVPPTRCHFCCRSGASSQRVSRG